jgi:acyl carrier protein
MAADPVSKPFQLQMRDIAFAAQIPHVEHLKQNDSLFNRTAVLQLDSFSNDRLSSNNPLTQALQQATKKIMNNATEFNSEIEQIVNAELGSISGSESLSEIGWDSMASVMFLAMADEKFSKAIAPEELAAAKTVADLRALVGIG